MVICKCNSNRTSNSLLFSFLNILTTSGFKIQGFFHSCNIICFWHKKQHVSILKVFKAIKAENRFI